MSTIKTRPGKITFFKSQQQMAGLWDDDGRLIGFWPAGYVPTQSRVNAVMAHIEKHNPEYPLPRLLIRALIQDIPVLDEPPLFEGE